MTIPTIPTTSTTPTTQDLDAMDLRVFVEPQQGATYTDQLECALAAEKIGYSGFFRSDHYLSMHCDGLPGPTDAWVTLGALARETHRIRLGTLVTSNTFRSPGELAIIAAQVDNMSQGRIEFGLGAGWYEAEHAAYAIDFPSTHERFERFAEALEIITGIWSTPLADTYNYQGKYYTLTECPALPQPYQGKKPPFIIGGIGKKRTPALAARYADEFNVPFHSAQECRAIIDRVDHACQQSGRTTPPIYSAALVVCVGKTPAELDRRAKTIGRDLDELKHAGLAGSPQEVKDKLRLYSQQGIHRIYGQFLDMHDHDHMELLYEIAHEA